MMPIYLEMKAFGPYRETQKIQFTRLREAGLFLICGVTGAGKTAILDGITYALYGTSSGGQRGDLSKMRCQFAQREEDTLLRFIMEHKGRRYGFQRRLKAKKRANGFQEEILCGEMKGDDIEPFSANIGARSGEKYAESLLGLTADQFRQVIILPQGKFEKLLTAGTKEKEEILSTLFGTEIWNKTAELVKAQANEQNGKLKTQEEWLDMALKKRGAESFPALLDGRDNLRKRIGDLALEAERAKERLEAARKGEDAGRILEDAFARLDEAQRTLADLEEKRPAMGALSQRLADHQRALAVLPSMRERDKADQEQAQRAAVLDDTAKKLEGEQEAFRQCQANYELIPKAEQEANCLEKKGERLKEDMETMSRLRKIREDAGSISQKLEKLSQENLDGQIAAQEVAIKELAEERERLLKLAAREEAASQQVKNMETAQKIDQRMKEIENEGKEIKRKWTESKAKREAAQQAEEAASAAFDQAYRQNLSDMAEALRQTLREGEPCPVCGSRTHQVPLEQNQQARAGVDLDKLKVQMNQAQQKLSQAERQYTELDGELRNAQEKYKLQRSHLRDLIGEEPFAPVRLDQARRGLRECQEARKGFEGAGRKMEEAEQELGRLTGEKEAAAAQRAELEKGLLKLQEQERQERERLVYGEAKGDIGEDIRKTEAKLQAKRRWIQEVNQAFMERTSSRAAAETAHKQSQQEWEKARENLAQAEKNLKAALEERGFASQAQAKESRMDDAEEKDGKSRIEDFQQSVAVARKNQEQLEAQLAARERPDMAALTGKRADAEERYNQLFSEQKKDEAELRSLEEDCRAIQRVFDQIAKQRPAIERMSAFSALLSGNTKVSLGRYVMGVMLSAVTTEADKLLENVHGGRYQIFRAKEESEKQSSKTGLAICVYDGYSGETRGADSLSGGEKFLVSLALSLGLAAVMQGVSGGIAIDSMFIDEGFGTLDEGSIDDALDMLATVKKSGRMVGIISHVGALRENIGCAVEVQKGAKGSRIEIHQ